MKIEFDTYSDPDHLRALAEFLTKIADSAVGIEEAPPRAESWDIGTVETVPEPTPTPEPPPLTPMQMDLTPDHVDVELDTAGVPWDERIHASTKTKVTNGTWKRRRGVPDEEVQRVMAELTGGHPGSNGSEPPPPPPVAEPTPQQAFGGETVTWPTVCGKVATAMSAGTYDPNREQQFLQQHGIQGNYAMLASRHDLLADFLQAMGL